jgi:hypothetical protein
VLFQLACDLRLDREVVSGQGERAEDVGAEGLVARFQRRRYRVYEVPIAYYGRTYAEGKKITWRDGFRAIWVLVAVRSRPSL